MNQSQRDFLSKFCKARGITEDEAMHFAMVIGVLDELAKNRDIPLTLDTFAMAKGN